MTVERRQITNRAEWLGWRKQNINASEVGIIAGADTYKTPLRLYAEKIGEVSPGETTNLMQRGLWLEPAVLAAAKDAHPEWEIEPLKVYLHDTETWIGCTPDARAWTSDGEILIQCKVVSRPVFERQWIGQEGDEPPIAYTLQALTEALLWDAKRCLLAVLIIDTYSVEYREFWVDRHPAAERKIRKMVAAFWADTAIGKPPRANYAKDLGLLAELYPPDEKVEPLDLTTDNRMTELLHDRAVYKDGISVQEKMIAAIDAEIVEKLNGATVAIARDYKITRKLVHRKEYVVPANSYPRMLITKKKEPANE